MANRVTKFVDVILPLALPYTYTYRVPNEWTNIVQTGQRLIVQFGRGRKLYTAIIAKVHENPPLKYEAKYIDSILDTLPIIHEVQLKFWFWLSEYYLANIGEVMNTALPAGLKLASETKIVLHPDYQNELKNYTDDEYLVIEALEIRNRLDLNELSQILNLKQVYAKIKGLIEKKGIIVEEELIHRYKPKMLEYVALNESYSSEKQLHGLFDSLERAPKQLDVLMGYVQMSQHLSKDKKEVQKSELLKKVNASSSLYTQMQKKGIFESYFVPADRLKLEKASQIIKELNPHQKEALKGIKDSFKSKEVVLLHGVTSSGKTELYIQLIQEVIQQGKQVLFLLPEIALTTQLVLRLQKVFGEKVGVFHSRFNENERVEVWNKVLAFDTKVSNQFQIIIGARSSMFLPFSKLGLIIIDEEHENSFKQYDPAPRYHARDSALVLARMHGAKTLLGSATPSIETYWNAKENKYGYVSLLKRHGEMAMPEITCVDIKEASKKKKMKSHFSMELIKAMEEILGQKKQIILFQNRRGYAPILLCETCGNTPQCVNCDVSLTYHKFKNELNCHYCSYHIPVPSICPSCGDSKLQVKGFGTEKIEEELAIFFPEAKVSRMDLDSTRSKKAYHTIITAFEEKAIDILVGTQMLSKGLDFDDVGLVAVLNADNMLNFPDFRAFERSYQLMSQVAGRAGRKGERGKVIIQSFNPDHQIIRQVIDQDYEGMYTNEMLDRRNFHYPPFYRLIKITLKHKEAPEVEAAAKYLAQLFKIALPDRVLGPEAPGIARIRNYFHQNILIKIERKASIKKAKMAILEHVQLFQADGRFKNVRVIIDVDPL